MQKKPTITGGTGENKEERTKSIKDFTQDELLSITPQSRHEAIAGPTNTFSVGRSNTIIIDLTVDGWYIEASWNLYDSTSGAYYYTESQTFSSSSENQVVALDLDAGSYSVDVWDTYGDGGIAGTVTALGGDTLVTWTDNDYTSSAQFGFEVVKPSSSTGPDLFFSEYIEGSSFNKAI